MHSDTNGWVLTWGQNHPSSILARTTIEWKVLIGSFDYPTLLTLRHRCVHTMRCPRYESPSLKQAEPKRIFPASGFSSFFQPLWQGQLQILHVCILTGKKLWDCVLSSEKAVIGEFLVLPCNFHHRYPIALTTQTTNTSCSVGFCWSMTET